MLIRSWPNRRGTIIPLLAVCSVVLFGFVALAIDLGMLMVARGECQNAADAASLAGTRVLDNRYPPGVSPDVYDNRSSLAIQTARSVVSNNQFLNQKFTDGRVRVARVGLYDYDPLTQRFGLIFPEQKPAGKSWTAVEVEVDGEQPAYFARVLGISTLPTSARAVSAHRPRDIALVLDLSGSMQFASSANWEPGTASSTDVVFGLLNPDPNYPRFGHYARYAEYQMANPNKSLATHTDPRQRPNPLQMRGTFIAGTGEVFPPNNHTIETANGPPLIRDFLFDPSNEADARIPATTVTSAEQLRNAFHRWEPPIVTAGDPNTLTPPTYDWSQYSAYTPGQGPIPAPPSFAEQRDQGGVTYVGDRHPRKGGVILPTSANWEPTSATGPARNTAELLHPSGLVPSPELRPRAGSPNHQDGGRTWDEYYDAAWEQHGLDLDVPGYIASNSTTVQTIVNHRFTGHAMGPGYWGKTFFHWPPDPRYDPTAQPENVRASNTAQDAAGRWICDWRRRFFLRRDGTPFDPQTDNDPAQAGEQSINQVLLRSTVGHVLRDGVTAGQRNYLINYRAVLAWLRSGPQVLPPNLRAGRVLYYTSIPETVENFATDADQRFWRDYIDFVLGYTGNVASYDPRFALAGVENLPWPEGSSIRIGATAAYPGDGIAIEANPRPYMNYTDQPNRPRMHFWFGPATMLAFLATQRPVKNWWPGNSHEAQDWQLKVGVQSAIEDIKNNHPNDHVGLAFFGYPHYTTPRVLVGQDWIRLRNALFYPRSLLTAVQAGNVAAEVRAFNSGFGSALLGDLPNANGQTDPNTGLALAFNMLRGPSVGGTGRKGAAKIVVFETDGVPNAMQNFTLSGTGENTVYSYGNTGSILGNGHPLVTQRAQEIATQLTLPIESGGHSLPNAPARIYPIAFGDLFSSNSPFKNEALSFLAMLAYRGQTAASPADPLPTTQIITGPSQTRIENLRTAFERILQSGVQVTLIE